jgi:SAM-dependent methyltransferase
MVIGSYLKKRIKILHGAIHGTKSRGTPLVISNGWWDDTFYGREISDARTISRTTSQAAATYHYASVEKLISRHFAINGVVSFDQILDIGSGAGHWLRFFHELGASRCIGLELSAKCFDALSARFRDNVSVKLYCGPASETLLNFRLQFCLVNAIGVMYHIVDDDEWARTIQLIGNAIKPGGLFVVSGHFGWFNNVNMQVDKQGRVNKRLRSRSRWREHLYSAGFTRIEFFRNLSYLCVRERLPENNVIIATK